MADGNRAELLPDLSGIGAPYWEALNQDRLDLQYCPHCERFQDPPETFCYNCGSSDIEWRPVSGEGTVYTFITVHQLYHPAFAQMLPYNVSIVELDEGPRILTNVIEIPNEEVSVGMKVRAVTRPLSDEQRGLFFVKA